MYKLKKSIGSVTFDICNYTFMVILSVLFIYPFWYILVLSFSTPEFATSMGLKLLPPKIDLTPYKEVFKSQIIYVAYFNTILRTLLGTFLTIIVTYCGAYVLTKKQLPFRNVLLIMILITMFFQGGLIPSFLLVSGLGLRDSIGALVLPGLTSAWFVIIARNFISSIPASLEEAAEIDGAHPFTIVFKIIFPISMPIISIIALWSAVGHWNAWFDAMIYMSDKNKMVLQLLLRRILFEQSNDLGNDLLLQSTTRTTPENIRAATLIVSVLPIITAYPFLQKYFLKGIMIGSLKG